MGYERYDLLAKAYSKTAETADGMRGLMSKVWYTLSYTRDAREDDYFFHTEYASIEKGLRAGDIYNGAMIEDNLYQEELRKGKENFYNMNNWHTDSTMLWYTTHTSVYNIQYRSLCVLVHEGLDGQKDWYMIEL